MFYITLRIPSDTEEQAQKYARRISDLSEADVVGVYPEHNTELDNDGQVIIYTGYIHPSHGA